VPFIRPLTDFPLLPLFWKPAVKNRIKEGSYHQVAATDDQEKQRGSTEKYNWIMKVRDIQHLVRPANCRPYVK
jgi:hypothetical protein